MPHSAAHKTPQLGREAQDATAEIRLQDALRRLGEAVAIREASDEAEIVSHEACQVDVLKCERVGAGADHDVGSDLCRR